MAIGTAYLAIILKMSRPSCQLLGRFSTEWIGISAISGPGALLASGTHYLKFRGRSAKSGGKKQRPKGLICGVLLGFPGSRLNGASWRRFSQRCSSRLLNHEAI